MRYEYCHGFVLWTLSPRHRLVANDGVGGGSARKVLVRDVRGHLACTLSAKHENQGVWCGAVS
jgi:hypothetical protein